MGFVLLPVFIVFITNYIFSDYHFADMIVSSDFAFAIVVLSATHLIDYVEYRFEAPGKARNLILIDLNIAILLLVIAVFFLAIVVLWQNRRIEGLSPGFIEFSSILLFFVIVVTKFFVFHERLSKSIYQSQKYFKSKIPYEFLLDIRKEINEINHNLLSIKFDVEKLDIKKTPKYQRKIRHTSTYADQLMNSSLETIDANLKMLETIKLKLQDRKQEIVDNC